MQTFTATSFDEVDAIVSSVLRDVESSFRTADTNGIWREVDAMFKEDHRGYFQSESGPDGELWKPLKPETVQRKGHDVKLRQTDDMRRSLTLETQDSVRQLLTEGSAETYVWGTSNWKSQFHQFGTSHIPIREHVGINDKRTDWLANVIADQLTQGMAHHG